MALYVNMIMPDSMQHTTPTQFLVDYNVQNYPPAFHVPRLGPKQTHWKRVGETSSRQSEYPCKYVRVFSGTQAGVGGHPNASDSQPDPVHASERWAVIWSFRRTPRHLLMCMSFICKMPSDLTFSWMRRVLKSRTLTWIKCKIKYDELDFFFF